ncbi:peptidyl-prolyl cis-trans isomerase [bacterium]|nr:peptidyl-prolyl cis-trans isomerase [bacterium]
MLDKVRSNVKSFGVQAVIVLVVAAFIGTIFLVWGHGGKTERQGMVLAKVFNMDVTYPEYQQEYIQLVNQYRQIYGDKWSDEVAQQLNLKRLAFDNIVNQYILIHKAVEWGINVSEKDVMDHIKSLPVFQINGKFSPEVYHQRLNMARVDPFKFENDIRRHMLFMKVQERIAAGFKIGDEEIMDEFAKKNEKIKADYLLVTPDRFMSTGGISMEEIREYYEKNKEKYYHPEKRSVEYLFLATEDFNKLAEIADRDIELYYSQHENDYVVPKQVRASHILISVDQGVSQEEDARLKEKALGLLDKIKAGEDFSELARLNSDCPSSKRGGELGYFGKGKMDPEFERAAFALDVGEISQVVRSSFGYHIIKAEGINPEHIKPLDQVKDEVIMALKQEKGHELAVLKAEQLMREIYKGRLLREFAFEDHVTYKEAGPFFFGESVPGIGRNKEIMETAFGMEKDKVSRIIETPKGYYIFRLTSVEPPAQMTYEESEARIENDLKMEKSKQLAHKEAEKIRTRLLNGEDMAVLAKGYGFSVSDTGEFGRGEYLSGLGNLDEIQTQMLFSLEPGDISSVVENNRGFVIFKVKEKTGINEKEFEEQKESLGSRLLQKRQLELFNTWVERVKKDADIEIYNEDLLT